MGFTGVVCTASIVICGKTGIRPEQVNTKYLESFWLLLLYPFLTIFVKHFASCFFLGTRISSFSQADLASRSIQYIHTSEVEKHSDSFTYSVSDGVNEVGLTKHIHLKVGED